MKRLLPLLLALSLPAALFADDFTIARENAKLPGGTTNVLSWAPGAPLSADVIELHVWGGLGADTVAVSRVSWCGCVTNALLTAATPGPVSLLVTNWGALSWQQGGRDTLRAVATGTNTPSLSVVYRQHRP